MHEIKITYKSFFRNREIITSFPTTWSEMNCRQFTALHKRQDDTTLLAVMLNVPKRIVRKMNLHQVYELAKLFDFIQKDTKTSSFNIESVCFPGLGTLYAPRPKLADMTFLQFIYVDSFYMQYAETANPDILRDFIAHLYTPGTGYDKKSADQAVPKLKKADLQIFEAIALNYGLVRKWIADRYPLIFPAQKQSFGKKSGSWAEIFEDIVGDDLKDQDKYAEIPINSVFRFITRKIKESRKQREHAAKLH